MNKNLILAVIGLVILGAVLFGVGVSRKSPTQPQNSGKISITASFYPLYFFASEIGKEKADVQNITPAGAEPHDYEPTPQDIARISNSRMLILNGGLEAWGDKIRDNLNGKNIEIVVAGQDLLKQQIEEEGKTVTDPHVWLSPPLAKKEVEKINQAYDKVDSTNSSFYDTNAKQLSDQLDQLDAKYKQGLSNCQKKDIITSHAAFGYLATSYGLNQVSVAGVSPDEEPSSQQIAEVADFAKKNNVKYIFFESLVSPKLSETIAREVGAETLVLDPLEGLSDDDIKAGRNYFTVMADNLKNLQLALECK